MKNSKTFSTLILLFCMSFTVIMSQTTLIYYGSTWSYYDNQNEPSDQGSNNWTDLAYNASTWSAGAAQLGYGDNDEVTTINSNTYTGYFRHEFNVTDPNSFLNLDLNLIYDDGAIVYLNGNEVWRVNMPSGSVGYNTFTPTQGSDNAQISNSISNALIAGTNVIAVEVHQRSSTSSDLSFDFQLVAQDNTSSGSDLIDSGSSWKYLDDGSNQGTAWRNFGFNDSGWSSGNAQLGFGEGDEATTISDVNQITNYFRKTITASASQAASTSLFLEAIRDDGMVVYINGVEVWRDYMPSGTISYNTVATTHVPDDGNDWQTNTIPNSLVEGVNVIAVEIHQNSSSSSDVSFDFKMSDSGGGPPPSSDELITDTDTWKYLDNGSNQGTAWYAVGYDDSSWSSGAAELGYGDGDETTTVGFGPSSTNKYPTTYFRKSFTVTDPSSFDFLTMEAIRDDAMAVYLNGNLVWSNNLPGSWDYQTYSTSTVGGADENTWLTQSVANTLVAGTNIVAVEIHQTNATSSDISFNFRLTGATAGSANLLRGPYLQKGTPSSVVVKWRTNVPTASIVDYGTSLGNLNQNMSDLVPKTDHEIEITGLSAYTKYYYKIAGSTNELVAEASDVFFRTHPTVGTSQPYSFWALGDAGTANQNQRNVRDAYYNYIGSNETDGIIFLGDNAYNDGTDSQYQNAVFENMYEDKLKNSITWSTLGNHDGYTADSNSQTGPYYDIFTFPTAGESGGIPSGTEAYYSYDYGNVHFIVLESYETDRSVGGAMYNWALNDIQNTTQDWIIAYWHHPPYTKGSHNSDTESNLIDMRSNFLPMLEQNGVDLVLSGHSHSYERSYFLNGHYGSSGTFNASTHTVGATGDGDGKSDGNGIYSKTNTGSEAGKGAVYITAGSSGKISGGSLNHNAMYASINQLGSCIVEVDGNELTVKFIRETGAIDDYFTIQKGCSSVGASCDDGDACTENDVLDSDCNCAGTPIPDSDGDGVCDTEDQCPGQDDALIGTACDDGDACTENDVYDENCGCSGTPVPDTDGDGVCDTEDQCPGQDDALIGTACDDGDDCTINDVYDENCGCSGTPDVDSDGDGVCDINDQCPGFDDALIGTSCDDGDACTENDVYDENCGCSGTPVPDSDGDGICDTEDQCPGFDDALIGTACDDGDACTENDVYDASCGCSGTPLPDSDGDGVCDTEDQCPGFDDALIGTSCDDGDTCTENDVYDENCGCVGTPVPDSDGDGVCDTEDQCPGFDDALIGTACDDGDNCTINDTYDSNCGCVGVPATDNDNDGYCSTEDPDDNDPCVPDANSPECVTCGDIIFDNFDSNWGNWNDGGSDCARRGEYAYSGSRNIRIRDNSGSASSMYTDVLDLSSYNTIYIEFTFYPYSMENNEDFFLEVSTNGGSSYTLIKSWVRNIDFTNNVRRFEKVAINGINFTNNSIIRFRCDASGNGDRIYIDDVLITSCNNTPMKNQNIGVPIQTEVITVIKEISIYPNPAKSKLFIDCKDYNGTQMVLRIYDLNGRVVKQRIFNGDYNLVKELDVTDLSEGLYLLRLHDKNGQSIKDKRIIIKE